MTLPKRTAGMVLATMAAVITTASMVSGHNAPATRSATASQPVGEPTIKGTWLTRVRPRNCATGEPVPVPPLRGLFTFHEGGTTSEYGIAPGSSPALRSPGHGVWHREPGWQEYGYAFTYNRYDPSGLFIGSTKVKSLLTLDPGGDAFTSNSAVEVFDANDNLIMTGCATAAGTRFE